MLALPKSNSSRKSGFTLVEILVVMTIILILSGIVISIQRGVSQKQAEAKAKGEMQAIATALESFKLKYGDYPWVSSGVEGKDVLFKTLSGEWIIYAEDDGSGNKTVTVGPPQSGRAGSSFLDVSKMSVDSKTSPTYFQDPWGNEYQYYYRASATGTWNYPGFILLSVGSDGQKGTDPGFASGNMPQSADEYYTSSDTTDDNLIYGLEF